MSECRAGHGGGHKQFIIGACRLRGGAPPRWEVRPEGRRADMKRTTTRTASQPTSRTSHALLTRSMSTGALALALGLVSQVSFADEGGVSFWIPGFFGSLAAAPLQPGWSLQTNYYHTSVSAGAEVARAREITVGKIPVTLNANLSATLDARADLGWAMPLYTFATPVLGGQATVGVLGLYGCVRTSLAGTLAGTLATPF